MKKNFIFSACALVALMLSACVKDTTADLNQETGVTQTITATIEGMTRTSMNDMEVGETAKVVWSSGDAIGVVTESGTIRKATINTSAVGKVDAEFTVTDAVAGEKYIYGFYPYRDGVKYADGKLTGVCLNNKRTFISNPAGTSALPSNGQTFATNELHMAAKPDGNGTLVFKSTCGIIEVQLTSSVSRNLYNITLFSRSKELSAYGTVDLTAARPQFVPYHLASYNSAKIGANEYGTHIAYMLGNENNGKGININNTAPVSLFFVVPVGTYDDLEMNISAGTNLAVTKKSTKSHAVKPNTILAFKPFDVNAVSNVYADAEVVDLSANGCAHTYLVPASASPKKYKFTAKMVGDTKEYKLPDGTKITSPNTSQNYNVTVVLAEDTEGVITDLRREQDIIYFTASKPGNAIVAIASTSVGVFNQFHIWVSDAKDQQLPGGHIFLDRNLGATYAPQSLAEAKSMGKEQIWRAAGCLYQWGNPTPRPSMTLSFVPDSYTSTSSASNATWTQHGWIYYPWTTDGYKLLPFTSGTNKTGFDRVKNYYNFYPVSDNTFADSAVTAWWHYNKDANKDFRFGASALWQETKTQFDPCPPGYRVPSKQEMADAFTNNGTHTSKAYKIAPGAAGQYYTYNNQFVFVSWSGMRKAIDADLLNAAFSNYPRTGWWFFDESLTNTDDLLAKYNGDGAYFYLNGKDQYSKTDKNLGKDVVYPACELRIGDTNWWVNNCQTENSVGAPGMYSYRYPVNTGMSIRCVRESASASSTSVAPSYNADSEIGF